MNADNANLNMPDINPANPYTQALSRIQLIENPTQDNGVSTSIVKVKNVKVQLSTTGVTDASGLSIYSMQVAILFAPEGFTPNIDMMERHPEWIMAYKLLTIDASSTIPINFSISSRLARNLNSGDAIYLVSIIRRASAETATQAQTGLIIPCFYTVQFWTCVN